ncbi:MAG: hypothetical protein U0452_01760 [Anaerolineae bacterium]
MRSDLRALVWLEWRKLRGNATYWLALLGFESGANPFYLVYVALFWAFWLYMMWALVIEQVYHASEALDSEVITGLSEGLPFLVFVGLLIYLIAMLRSSPLKFGGPAIEYVSTSPARRGIIILVHFIRSLFLPTFALSVLSSLLAMLLTWSASPGRVGMAGLQAAIITFPIVWMCAALVWIIVAFRTSLASRAQRLAVWLVVPALILLALIVPPLVLYPGGVWMDTIRTRPAPLGIGTLCVLAGVAFVILVRVGDRVSMTTIADDSRMYARIQKLGIFGRLYAPDVISSVQRQSKLAAKRKLQLALPEHASGYRVVLNRALLSLFRLAPSTLFRLVMRGAVFGGLVAFVVRLTGWQNLQTWVLLLLFVIQFRPSELNNLFRQDVGQAFTRQFLPRNPLKLVLADSLFPIMLFSTGAAAILMFQPSLSPLITVVLVLTFVTGLQLCQALELVTIPSLFLRHIPYAYLIVICGVFLVAAVYLFKNPFGVMLIAIAIDIILAGMLSISRYEA